MGSENHITNYVNKIQVKGLHGRLDFEVLLNPGMNIIYGKNGRGKTTLLHILANVSERDFSRFKYLNFDNIEIEYNNIQKISIQKKDGNILVLVNDHLTSFADGNQNLTDAEMSQIQEIIGEPATYLPAFRSVLERMRESPYSPYEDRKRPDFDEILLKERAVLSGVLNSLYPMRRIADTIASTATKTLRCRDWFGEFVPTIRYPSILDVVDGLVLEWENVQLGINRLEQKQFEDAFVEIFQAISTASTSTSDDDDLNQDELLSKIKDLSAGSDDQIGPVQYPPQHTAFQRLVKLASKSNKNDKKYNGLLQIYLNVLEGRKLIRENLMQHINGFERAVNTFLDQKKLKVGYSVKEQSVRGARASRASVWVNSDNGKPYVLTSLSSGERQIATMLYSASRSVFRSGAFLIDEPELSLHIDWQRAILTEILKQHPNRQIIACTHSPEVGADHADRIQDFEPTHHDIGPTAQNIDEEDI